MMHLRTCSSKVFVVLASLVLLGSARVAAADTITLMWDANPEPAVTGYIVHVGTQPGAYTQHIDVGPFTGYAFSTALAGQQYCFAVTAYVAGPLEGPPSDEVCGYSNRPPTLVNPGARTSQLSQATTLQLQGVDPDGQPVSYSATGLPAGLTLQSSTGFISGTPTSAGAFTVNATVSDGVLTVSQSFTWTIAAPDVTAPTVTITGPTSATTYTTTTSTVTLTGSAADNVAVTQLTWVNDRGGSGTATGTTSWSAANVTLQAGANILTVTARDAAGNTSSDVLTVTYNGVPVNGAPTLTNPGARSSNLAQTTSLQLGASDPNGDTLTYSVTALPPGLSLTASSGLIAGTPVMTGSYPVTATVSDGALSASQTFTWTITPNASASTGTIRLMWDANTDSGLAGYIVHAGTQTGSYVQHYDVGLTTSYLFSNAVLGQRYCFTVSAYLAGPVEGPSSTEVCGYANIPPTLASVGNQSSNAGQAVTLQLSGSDPEGSTLTYGATGLPAGLAVNAATGLISGTPTTAGAYSVTATVSDGLLTSSRSFTWTIVSAGDATVPTVTITGPTSAATFTTTTSTVTVSGTASDNVGVTQVTWTNDRGGSGNATGTTTWNTGAITLQSGVNILTVIARDAAGNVATDVLTVTFNVAAGDTTAPVIVINGPTLNATYTTTTATLVLSGTASDNVGVTQVTWASNRGGSGTASGTTSWTGWSVPLLAGVNILTVTARDAAGNTGTDVLTVTVSNVAPTLAAIANQTAAIGQAASLQLVGADANGGPLSYAATGLPPGLSVNASTGAITGTPTVAGTYSVTATVSDGALTASRTFTWTISAGDTTVPVIVINGPTSAATYTTTATTLVLSGTASDNVGVTQVNWVSNRGGSGTASGTTSWTGSSVPLLTGVNILTVTARDAAGNTATDVLTVTRGSAPTLASVASQVTEAGQAALVQLSGSDADGDLLTYGANGLPPGVALNVSTGVISGTPAETGVYAVTANVFDGSQSASQSFTWTVTADATAPIVTITAPTTAATYASSGSSVALSGTAIDSVGVTQVSWQNNRGGSGVATGITSWSTGAIALQSGVNVLTVTARDQAGNASVTTLTVTVNVAPALASVSDQATELGRPTTLQLSGSDADGDALTYGATGLPPGVVLTVATGAIAGTPSVAGTFVVTATVSDAAQSASRSFTWTVTPDATAPAVTITGPTASSTYAASATPLTVSGTASDSVGVAQVSWANNRGGSGTATGTTSWSIAGIALQSGANVITVTARDGAGNATTDTLTVTFNSAPVLAAVVNQSTAVGTAASLQLAGSDPDGDTLTYTAIGLPVGLALAPGTGAIAGTPTTAGTYSVTATVSDGALTASRTFTWTILGGDATAPVIVIDGPTLSPTYTATSATLVLSGTASDNVGVTQVTWASNRGGSGTASGTTAWTGWSVPLLSGSNILTVTARDAAGNTATDVLTVTYNVADSVAPTVEIRTPTTAASYTTVATPLAIGGVAADNVGVTQVTWVNNRGGSGTATGTTSWSASAALQAGTNVLTVTARDAAGNASTDVLTVYLNVAPTLANVSNRTTRIGQTVSLQLVGADANGDVLTYSATGLPAGLSLNASTGLISGSPTTVGTYAVTVTVTDGTISRSRAFTWTIRVP